MILLPLRENNKSGAFKRGEAPLLLPSPSPLKERGSGGEVDK